jgi:hypothetical protein
VCIDQHALNTLLVNTYVISLLVGTLVEIMRLVSNITFSPRGIDVNAYSIGQLLLFDMIIYLCAAPAPSTPLSTNSCVNIWRRLILVCFFLLLWT